MNGNAEEFGNLFREHTTVHQHHLMPNKEYFQKNDTKFSKIFGAIFLKILKQDVGFVHIDEKTCEQVIEKMDGTPFNGGQMKIGYGQIGPKPRYDRNAPKGRVHRTALDIEACRVRTDSPGQSVELE